MWGLLGVVLSPFVVGSTAAIFSAAGYDVRTLTQCVYKACTAVKHGSFRSHPFTCSLSLLLVCATATSLYKAAEA